MSGPGPAATAWAWAWADHLRAGGATPWLEWLPTATPSDSMPGRGTPPGAAQLEFVRRLAERRATGVGSANPSFATLADLVLARSGPGRGPAYLPLLWPGDERPASQRRVGAPPVDPSAIPPGELCRVGAGVLVELLVRAEPNPAEPPRPPRRQPRRRPWQRAFHLAGAPATVARVRDALAAAGHVEGGRSPEVVLAAEPLDLLLAQIWSARVQSGAPVRWVAFAARWAARDRLPPSANLSEIAAVWAKRVGPDRVHVVTGPDPVRQTADLLGVTVPASSSTSHELAPAAVDLLRRLNRVLHVRVPQDQIAGHLRRATALLPSAEPTDAVLRVPDAQRAWVDARSRRITDDLRAGGYAVHGDLDRIAPRHVGAPHPRSADVLDLVLDTCLRAAELTA